MSLVKWSDDLSVGIQEIDEQHKVLVNLLNDMHDAIHQHRGTEACREILERLARYTEIHFAVEESLMRLFDYPDYEAHKAEHEQLIKELKDLQGRMAESGHSVTFQLLHFLKLWLTKHIMESDQEYTQFFLRAGVKAKHGSASWFKRIWA